MHSQQTSPIGNKTMKKKPISTGHEKININIIPHRWTLTSIIPLPNLTKTWAFYAVLMTHFTSLSNFQEEPLSIHHKQYTTHQHTTRCLQSYSTFTALHNVNNTMAGGFNQLTTRGTPIIVDLIMCKTFDRVYIHTLTMKCIHTHHHHYYLIQIKLHQRTQRIHNIHITHINRTLV